MKMPGRILLLLVAGLPAAAGPAKWVSLEAAALRHEAPASEAWISPEVPASGGFTELVVSWNPRPGSTNALRIEAQVRHGTDWGRIWRVADWSPTPGPVRTSLDGQSDSTGRMETDTLVLRVPGVAARVRVADLAGPSAVPPVSRISLAFWRPPGPSDSEGSAPEPVPPIAVPVRSQAEFPEGVDRWCSPTSTSMLLAHWASVLSRPSMDRGVRQVAAGVDDPAWGGTGNWVFNTAFAGSVPGLQAGVARLSDASDLRALVAAGIPVAVSVSYAQLKGAEHPAKGDGHLVVVCGFGVGTVVVNDPGVRPSRVRREFPFRDFDRAWASSHRTAYLVWPEDRPLPTSPSGTW